MVQGGSSRWRAPSCLDGSDVCSATSGFFELEEREREREREKR